MGKSFAMELKLLIVYPPRGNLAIITYHIDDQVLSIESNPDPHP